MEAGFWHERWQLQQIGFHQQDVNPFLLRHWSSLDLSEACRVFVPLCGKSLDMCFLAEMGHEVLGCELNESAAEQFFSENRLPLSMQQLGEHRLYSTEQVGIYQGDIFTLSPGQTADCGAFYDRAALIAWPESMRRDYVAQLARLMPGGSQGLLITLDFPVDAIAGPPFAVSDGWITQHMSGLFDIERLDCQDVLADNPRFIKRQVPWLTESVYRLRRKG